MKNRIIKWGLCAFAILALVWVAGDWGYAHVLAARMASVESRLERDSTGVRKGCEAFTVGQGSTAILLVHGFADSPAVFRPMAALLAEDGFTCRAMRLPGAAMPLAVSRTVTRQQWEEEILREIRVLRKTHAKVWLAGHSMGGALSAKIAAQYPEEVDGLVLLAPLVEVSTRRSLGCSMRPVFEAACQAWVFTDTFELIFPRDLREPSAAGVDLRDRFIPFSVYRQLFELTDAMRGLAPRIRQPLLLVISTSDRVVDPSAARRFFTECASLDKYLVESVEAGHVLQMDRGWQELARTLSDFIEPRNVRNP